MKKILSFALVLMVFLSLLPVSFADNPYEEDIREMEKAVSGWKDVQQLYDFDGSLFAVTEKGKVLTTDERYEDSEKWTDVVSLCCLSAWDLDDGFLVGVCGNGDLCGIIPDGGEKLAGEISKWKNIKQLYGISSEEYGSGFCAICNDGSVRYTKNLEEMLGELSGVKLKSFCCRNGYFGLWAAVTNDGKVLTNIEEACNGASGWKNVDKLWMIERYDSCYLLARLSNGSTVIAPGAQEDSENAKIEAAFKKCKKINSVAYDYEDDWVLCITDDGNADVIYMSEWYESDDYGIRSYVNKVKNAVSAYSFFYLEPENTDESLEAGINGPLLVLVCSDGTIADLKSGGQTVRFEPEESGAKIVSLVSLFEDSAVFGLTEKGTVTRIHIISASSGAGSSAANYSDGEGSPSAADLDAIGTKITYPKAESYLDEYFYGVITPGEGKTGVYAYTKSKGGEKLRTIDADTEVTVIAEENGRYCVIVESTGKAYWINTKYIP